MTSPELRRRIDAFLRGAGTAEPQQARAGSQVGRDGVAGKRRRFEGEATEAQVSEPQVAAMAVTVAQRRTALAAGTPARDAGALASSNHLISGDLSQLARWPLLRISDADDTFLPTQFLMQPSDEHLDASDSEFAEHACHLLYLALSAGQNDRKREKFEKKLTADTTGVAAWFVALDTAVTAYFEALSVEASVMVLSSNTADWLAAWWLVLPRAKAVADAKGFLIASAGKAVEGLSKAPFIQFVAGMMVEHGSGGQDLCIETFGDSDDEHHSAQAACEQAEMGHREVRFARGLGPRQIITALEAQTAALRRDGT